MNTFIYSLLENTLKLCITNIFNTSLFNPDIIQNILFGVQNNKITDIPTIDKSIIKLIKHIRMHTDMNKIYKMCIKLRKKVKNNNLLKPILFDCINTMIFIINTNLETIHKLKESKHNLEITNNKLEETNKQNLDEILKLQNDIDFLKKSKSSVQLKQTNNIMLEIIPIYE
jgi:hypothetical protein